MHTSVLSFQVPAKPTTTDQYWLSALYVVSLLASFYNSLPIELRIVLMLLISASWIINIKRNREISIDYIELELRNGNQWTLREQGGQKFNATLMPSTVNTPFTVFLHLDLGSAGKRYLMIRRNQIEQEQFRQLRVALKTSSAAS
ncbi:MAG: protein YgfX [Methylococcales bacterium]